MSDFDLSSDALAYGFVQMAAAARDRYERSRAIWREQHPQRSPAELQRLYELRHSRFVQDLGWFPSWMWEGCVKKTV